MKKVILSCFAIFSVMTLLLILIFNYVLFPKKYSEFVEAYAEKYSLEAALVYAVIKAESGFRADAVSGAGAVGLMQIMPSTAAWIAGNLGVETGEGYLLDTETNIRFGCYYISYLFSRFGEIKVVIAAYNAGETVVSSWLDEGGDLPDENIAYSETKTYVKKVLRYYKIYKT